MQQLDLFKSDKTSESYFAVGYRDAIFYDLGNHNDIESAREKAKSVDHIAILNEEEVLHLSRFLSERVGLNRQKRKGFKN